MIHQGLIPSGDDIPHRNSLHWTLFPIANANVCNVHLFICLSLLWTLRCAFYLLIKNQEMLQNCYCLLWQHTLPLWWFWFIIFWLVLWVILVSELQRFWSTVIRRILATNSTPCEPDRCFAVQKSPVYSSIIQSYFIFPVLPSVEGSDFTKHISRCR